jgi:Fe-S-cluster-containing dehydrogenase component
MLLGKLKTDRLKEEDPSTITVIERREFLKLGLLITGVFAGGGILSATSIVGKAFASTRDFAAQYPFKPHYSMVIHQDRCIDCELCMTACVKTNNVPAYGYRTRILERYDAKSADRKREFIPVLCNQCNNPPCVTGCPTKATYKSAVNGIVMMEQKKCIGCKTCMAACPYNARYFNEETRAVDKCDFCFGSRLSKGEKLTACAAVCPAKARIFGDLAEPSSEVFQTVHNMEKTVWVLRPEAGAKPNVFYTKG